MLSLSPISHVRFQSRSHSSKPMINPATLDLPTTEFPRIVGVFDCGPATITVQGYYETKSEFRVNFWNLNEPDPRKRPLGNIILKAHKAPDGPFLTRSSEKKGFSCHGKRSSGYVCSYGNQRNFST